MAAEIENKHNFTHGETTRRKYCFSFNFVYTKAFLWKTNDSEEKCRFEHIFRKTNERLLILNNQRRIQKKLNNNPMKMAQLNK